MPNIVQLLEQMRGEGDGYGQNWPTFPAITIGASSLRSSAVAWTLTAQARQGAKVPRIG